MTAALTIAAQVRQLLENLPRPSLAPFLDEWPHSPAPREVPAAGLPVLRWLGQIGADAPEFAAPLVHAVAHAAPSLAWRRTYSAQQVGAAFLDNYGWSELFGAHGPLASERIACGFLILGPAILYPRHFHEAEELYLPLCGTAAWQQGDAAWQDRPPGTLIHHAGNEPHAMRTGTGPLLALYLWRSADLAQKARLGEPAASPAP